MNIINFSPNIAFKNNSEKYEVELKSETIVNISYTEIVEGLKILDSENVYVYKEGKTQEAQWRSMLSHETFSMEVTLDWFWEA